jgi:hypothetical protein
VRFSKIFNSFKAVINKCLDFQANLGLGEF